MNQPGKRNNNVDILKLVCAVFVMIIHIGAPFARYYEPVIRCGVPCFFIISGYFLYVQTGFVEKLRTSICRIFSVLLWSTFVFFLYSLFLSLKTGDFSAFLFPPDRVMRIILFNDSVFGFHLWYLLAYLYVLVIFYFLAKYRIRLSFLFILVPFLLTGSCVFGKYSVWVVGHELPCYLTRNFLFAGIPYFSIGVWLKKNSGWLQQNASARLFIFWGMMLFLILSVLEKWILCQTGMVDIQGDYYVCTPFLSAFLFLYFVCRKPISDNVLARTGRQDSLYLYIYHPVFTLLNVWVAQYVIPQSVAAVYNSLSLLFVFVYTLIFTQVCRRLHLLK